MGFLVYLSDFIMPLLFFYIIGFGLLMKVNVYDEFVKGAKKGLSTVVSILPTLVGLMMGHLYNILLFSTFYQLKKIAAFSFFYQPASTTLAASPDSVAISAPGSVKRVLFTLAVISLLFPFFQPWLG